MAAMGNTACSSLMIRRFPNTPVPCSRVPRVFPGTLIPLRLVHRIFNCGPVMIRSPRIRYFPSFTHKPSLSLQPSFSRVLELLGALLEDAGKAYVFSIKTITDIFLFSTRTRWSGVASNFKKITAKLVRRLRGKGVVSGTPVSARQARHRGEFSHGFPAGDAKGLAPLDRNGFGNGSPP